MRIFLRPKFAISRICWGNSLTRRSYQSQSIPNTIAACQLLIEECVRDIRPQQAEEILQEMLRLEMKPDVIIYTSVINSYAEAELPNDAARIHQEMIDSGFSPNVISYTTVMKAYGRVAKPQESEQVFNEMVSRGIMPNPICFSTLVHAYAKASLPYDAERLLRKSQQNYLISASQLIYHPVIGGYNRLSLPEQAERLLNEMILINLANVDTYGMVIDAYANTNRVSDAERVYNLSISHGIQPSPVILNPLLKAFANCHDPVRAEELLMRNINQHKQSCDTMSYNTVMSAYLNSYQSLDSERIYNLLIQQSQPDGSLKPNDITRQLLLAGFIQRKEIQLFYQLFDEISNTSSEFFLQSQSTRYFINLFCETSPQEAEKFLQKMEAISPSSVDLVAYQLVVQSFVRILKPSRGYDLLFKYFQSRAYATHNSSHEPILLSVFNSLIHGFCKIDRPDLAEEVLEELPKRGIRPDLYSYTPLISVYTKGETKPTKREHASSRLKYLLNEIHQRQFPLTVTFFSILIQKSLQDSNYQEMNSLLERMKSEGLKWDCVIYSQVMLKYAKFGDLVTVERLYREITDETDIQPNSFIFQSLIIAAKRAGDHIRAKEWFERAVVMLQPTQEMKKREKNEGERSQQINPKHSKTGRDSDIEYLKRVLEREERGVNDKNRDRSGGGRQSGGRNAERKRN